MCVFDHEGDVPRSLLGADTPFAAVTQHHSLPLPQEDTQPREPAKTSHNVALVDQLVDRERPCADPSNHGPTEEVATGSEFLLRWSF